MSDSVRVACISDTHGFLDPRLFDRLAGVDRILHAGDVGADDILIELGAIAPVAAVRGNVDGPGLPEWLIEEIAGARVGMTHIALGDGARLLPEVARRVEDEQLDLLLFGHTHKPWRGTHGKTILLNPGSAGKPRFHLRPSLAIAQIAAPPTITIHPLSL